MKMSKIFVIKHKTLAVVIPSGRPVTIMKMLILKVHTAFKLQWQKSMERGFKYQGYLTLQVQNSKE